jgi:putative ABC transport system permease protein
MVAAAVRRFVLRLFAFVRSARAERELDQELATHLALLEDEHRRRGLPPEEARREARRDLGGVEIVKEEHRDARSFPWLEDARRDARHALRGLARDRGFTCAALLTLALGIGATTALFGGLNAVLLRPLPLPDPDRLVFVFEVMGANPRVDLTAPDFLDWRRQQSFAAAMAASCPAPLTLVDRASGEASRVPASRVSANYFRALGLKPLLGRDFAESDDVFGAARTVLLGHAIWRDRFGADPAVLGSVLTLNGESHTVIGVLPPGQGLSGRDEQLYVPLALSPRERGSTGNRFLTVVARLSPGVSRQRAEAEMKAIAAQTASVRPKSNQNVSAHLEDARQVLVGDLRRPLLFFLGAAMFLLLIACANVANLQLVRALARQREMGIRFALGAGRCRLVRQLAMEGLVLGALGGAAGLAAAVSCAKLVPWLIPGTGSLMTGADFLDLRVLAWVGTISVATGLLFGLVPAWWLTRPDAGRSLNERGAATGSGGQRAGGLFAVAQIAVALLLLIGAGLSIRSFARLGAVDPGFRPANLLTFRLSLPDARYGAPGQTESFFAELVAQLRALPGVTSAAGTSSLPLRSTGLGVSARREGDGEVVDPSAVPFFQYRAITPGYFRTLSVPLVRGRELSADDRAASAGGTRVALINRAAARTFWPDADPIGARIKPDDKGGPVEIVGVVGDTRGFGLGADLKPELFLALPQVSPSLWRWNQRTFDLVVRTAGAAEALAGAARAVVQRLDPGLSVDQMATMDTVVAQSMDPPRRAMLLMLSCGGIALVLAALGLYGVMAFLVAGRQQEIGVRVALGATGRQILALVLGRTARLCAVGLGLGVVAALGLSRFVATFLYGVSGTDATTYVALSALLFAVSLAAAYLPARRAMRVDPMSALRAE